MEGLVSTIAGTVSDPVVTRRALLVHMAGSAAATVMDGYGTSAIFNGPRGIVFYSHDFLYVADTSNHRIRYMNLTTGYVGTLAGESLGFADGQGTVARFRFPVGIDVDSRGTVIVADGTTVGGVPSNNAIRTMSPSGKESTFLICCG